LINRIGPIWAAVLAVLAMPRAADGEGTKIPIDTPSAFRTDLLLGAHRGGGGLWPENTLLAFTRSAARWPGVLLEGDVRLSADGQVVILHDKKVDRTTNGAGLVEQLTLAELKALDAGYRFSADGGKTFPYRGKGITVPTLAEVLAALPKQRFLFELKEGEALPEATVAVVRAAQAEDRFMLASFKAALIEKAKELAPEIATCYGFPGAIEMMRTLREGDWDAYVPTDCMLSVATELAERFQLKPEEIQRVRAKGVLYQVHTLNDPAAIRSHIEMGVDSILTDRPDLLAQAIAEMKRPRPTE